MCVVTFSVFFCVEKSLNVGVRIEIPMYKLYLYIGTGYNRYVYGSFFFIIKNSFALNFYVAKYDEIYC